MVTRLLRSRFLYIVLGFCVVGFWLLEWVESLGGPAAFWRHFGLLAPAVSVPIQVVVAVTPFPSDVICVGNGVVYGFWLGASLSWTGWYLAALIEFYLGRRAQAEFPLDQWMERLPTRMQRLPIAHPMFLIASRWVPWAGGHISTLLPGAAGVPWARFAWCAAIAIVPPSLLMAGIGAGLWAL